MKGNDTYAFPIKIRVFAFFEILDNNQTFTSYFRPVGQRHDKKRYKYESLYTACYTTIFDHFLFFIISLHFFLLIEMTTAFTSTSNLSICNTLLRNFELVCVCVFYESKIICFYPILRHRILRSSAIVKH